MLRHAARNIDPTPSHDAADYMASSGGQRLQIDITAAVVAKYPGCTAVELSRKTGVDRYVLGRRLSECCDEGTVRRGVIRRCSVSKRLATTWYPPQVAEQLPLALALVAA